MACFVDGKGKVCNANLLVLDQKRIHIFFQNKEDEYGMYIDLYDDKTIDKICNDIPNDWVRRINYFQQSKTGIKTYLDINKIGPKEKNIGGASFEIPKFIVSLNNDFSLKCVKIIGNILDESGKIIDKFSICGKTNGKLKFVYL